MDYWWWSYIGKSAYFPLNIYINYNSCIHSTINIFFISVLMESITHKNVAFCAEDCGKNAIPLWAGVCVCGVDQNCDEVTQIFNFNIHKNAYKYVHMASARNMLQLALMWTNFIENRVCGSCAVIQLVMSAVSWSNDRRETQTVNTWYSASDERHAILSHGKLTLTRCLLMALKFVLFSAGFVANIHASYYEIVRPERNHMHIKREKMSSKIMLCRLPFVCWLPFFCSIWLWLAFRVSNLIGNLNKQQRRIDGVDSRRTNEFSASWLWSRAPNIRNKNQPVSE